ncbi:MAG TPA: Asp-tRNA(Asn)/Glu-tRNA(Gln) amidotransferase GatCAB subunit C [Candidatus Thermoplasmatota archaeon]|nr:Asp-tRNA(Asn)/Glu-tRNA(Gln) amidotransferase GatCAB subunit C [Candidatus Thermoplasmatota archaeon]
MPGFDRDETRRIARLARLDLDDAEVEALARDLDAITRAFSDLADFAAALPPPAPPAATTPRDDVAAPAPERVVEAIHAAFPRRDAATGAVRAPKGAP